MKKQADETFGKGILLEKEAQFEKAKAIYEDLFRHVTDETVPEKN
jgi:trimethylamine--corrinoid protein Co-methyltransferase